MNQLSLIKQIQAEGFTVILTRFRCGRTDFPNQRIPGGELDTVVACVGLANCHPGLLIYNLCVDTSQHGQGIGRQLVAWAKQLARHDNYDWLLAASKHQGEWFTSLGFVEVDPGDARRPWPQCLRRGRASRLYIRGA